MVGVTALIVANNIDDMVSAPYCEKLTKLSKWEVKQVEKGGEDIYKIKEQHPKSDLYEDENGDIYILPKSGKGPGVETGLNIKDFIKR